MTVQATAKRRRRQMSMGNIHVAKLGRHVYRKKNTTALARKLAEMVRRQNEMQQRKAKKK